MLYVIWILLAFIIFTADWVSFSDKKKTDNLVVFIIRSFCVMSIISSLLLFTMYDTTIESPTEYKVTMTRDNTNGNSIKLIGITKEGWVINEILDIYNMGDTDINTEEIKTVRYRIHRMRYPWLVLFKYKITDIWVSKK